MSQAKKTPAKKAAPKKAAAKKAAAPQTNRTKSPDQVQQQEAAKKAEQEKQAQAKKAAPKKTTAKKAEKSEPKEALGAAGHRPKRLPLPARDQHAEEARREAERAAQRKEHIERVGDVSLG